MLHWNINSMFRCSFACKATIASTEGHAVTFILQSVLKEAWNVWGRRLAAARHVIFLPVFHRWLKTDACCALLQARHILKVWKLLMPERHHNDLFGFFSSPLFLIETKLHECAISCRSVKTQLHEYDDDPPPHTLFLHNIKHGWWDDHGACSASNAFLSRFNLSIFRAHCQRSKSMFILRS